MDRFVTRAPTWKTLNYGSLVAQNNRSTTNSKFNSTQITTTNTKSVSQAKHQDEFVKTQDLGSRLASILRPTNAVTAISSDLPLAENLNSNSNDSGLSSSSSISPPQPENIGGIDSPLKKMQTPRKNRVVGKLGDYVECAEEKENDTCLTLPHTPKSSKKATETKVKVLGLKENTPSKQILPQTPKVNKPITTVQSAAKTAEKLTPSNPMLMSRIQRDLNSPSASVRVRALKAIASPTKSPYTHFDIPEAEQSLNFSAVQEPPDIREVMRNIVVYVEVKSGEDNRSEGVRKVIEALGARVNLKLLRDTTHVVFKDGLLSTFKKAQQWGIPVVSILWIEACKTKNRICDPKEYPISNLDRYENPELYARMKRFKYMQPDSEKFISRKVTTGGGSAQKDLTPTQKTGAIRKNSTLYGSTPTGSSNTKKKTDISQYFKKLDSSNQVLTTPIASSTVAANTPSESPATLLLNRINSNCYTPLMQSKKTATTNKDNKEDVAATKNIECYDEESCDQNEIAVKSNAKKVKKTLNFLQTNESAITTDISCQLQIPAAPSNPNVQKENDAIPATPTPVKPPRRRSMLLANEKISSANNVSATPTKPRRRSVVPVDEKTDYTTISVTPSKKPSRRSSVHTPKNMTIETPKKDSNFDAIIEEDTRVSEEQQTERATIVEKSVKQRRTLHSIKPMELSEQSFKPHNGEICSNAIKENQPSPIKYNRRRTLYSCTSMNKTSIAEKIDTTNVTTRRPKCYSVKTIEKDTISSSTTTEMTTQKSTDQHNKILLNKNNKSDEEEKIKSSAAATAPKTHSNNRRRTLYTPRKISESVTTHMEAAVAPQTSDGICITPTANSMTGKVICSTLLESADKPKPIHTPPATATTGKLLEETQECVTPLIFSSTRQPGNRRRTLFDVSMDIITQRLQCINQSARRSLAPTPADNNCSDIKSFDAPPALDTRKPILPNTSDTENSSTPRSSSTITNNGASTPELSSPAVTTLTRKRKLFVPNEILTPPPNYTTTACSNNTTMNTPAISSDQKSVSKRRRTLVPLSQPSMSSGALNSSDVIMEPLTPVLKRRSTLDFEQIKKIENKKAPNDQSNGSAVGDSNNGIQLVKPKKKPILVHTNMHKEQIDVIHEAIDKLSHFNLEQTVTDSTTHLVSLEPRRTMNLLRAMARGLWIVDYNWVLESMKAGEWLPEEPYELREFSRAIEICRSERQAFGDHYKCELFRDLGAFYISIRCYPMTKDDLCELITLCGGRLSLSRNKARYIIGDTNPTLEDKLYVTPYWILDSISQMQIMKIQKYLVPMAGERPLTQSPPIR